MRKFNMTYHFPKQKALPTNLSSLSAGLNAPIPIIISSSLLACKRQGMPLTIQQQSKLKNKGNYL